MIDYELYLKKSDGSQIGPIDQNELELDVQLKLNSGGTMTLTLPCCDYDFATFAIDDRIEICYSCSCQSDSKLLGNSPFFVARKELCEDANGNCTLKLICTTATDLLSRRIVAYTQDSPQGKSTNENAVDLIYRIWAQNGGDPAQTGSYNTAAPEALRDWSSCISTCAHSAIAAPNVSLTFGGQTLLDAFKAIADAAFAKDGTEIFFSITQAECCTGELEFCVTTGQPGEVKDVTISPENETLGAFCMSSDYRGSANRVYVTDSANAVIVVDDTNLATTIADNCFALREVTTSTSGTGATESTDTGNGELKRLSRTESIDGTMSEYGNLEFGCDWDYGDRVNVTVNSGDTSYTYSTVISSLHFNQKAGTQTIESSLSQASSGVTTATGVGGLVAQVKQLEAQVAKLKAQLFA